MGKKRFSERSLPAKAGLIALAGTSLGIVASAERDLRNRPSAEIRGSKRAWQLVSRNALGALAYLRVGRRG